MPASAPQAVVGLVGAWVRGFGAAGGVRSERRAL
jgi:hypothetical protein